MIGREKNGQWENEFFVHSYEVDFRSCLTLHSLCCYFQEAAWQHAEHLNLGFNVLREKNQAWILSRMFLNVSCFPRWGARLILRTWPRGAKGLFALRDFELLDEHGNACAAGSSAWVLIDLSSHRPHRIEPLIEGIPVFPNRRALERDSDKVHIETPLEDRSVVEVRYGDLDMNNHVNNARYISWILDSYPIAFHETHRLRSIEINYVAETVRSERVVIRTGKISDLDFSHSLVRVRDNVEVCRGIVAWVQEE